jgi:hypothetical protein
VSGCELDSSGLKYGPKVPSYDPGGRAVTGMVGLKPARGNDFVFVFLCCVVLCR